MPARKVVSVPVLTANPDLADAPLSVNRKSLCKKIRDLKIPLAKKA